jgi:hypothetical protein
MDNVIKTDMLKKALEIYENKQLDSLEEKPFDTTSEFDAKMRRLIESQNSVYKRITLTKTRKVLAAMVAAMIILVSALSVGAIRDKIFSFFVNHGKVKIIEYDTENSKEYPKTLKKLYALSAVPDGYKLTDSGTENDHLFRIYTKGDNYLSFEQFTKESYKSATDIEFIGKENYKGIGYVVQNDGDTTVLTWEKDGYVFELAGFLDKNEMLSLARSAEYESGGEE